MPVRKEFKMDTYTSNSTLCCHWCKIPLGNASQVTYLNGNLPICDLCLGTAQAQILSAFADKDKKIAELEAQVEKLKCCGNCTSFMIDDHHVL